jgi:hypothetical protein
MCLQQARKDFLEASSSSKYLPENEKKGRKMLEFLTINADPSVLKWQQDVPLENF